MSYAEPINYNAPVDIRNAEYVKHMSDYDWMYSFVYEFTSFSIFTTVFMACYAYLHNYCLYSWVCIVALFLLSICNMLHYFYNFDYLNTYIGLIIIPCIIFAAIYRIKK